MTIHLVQQRYSAVIGAEGQIFLRGVLDESSDLRQTLDLIKERHKHSPDNPIELDFTHLVSGSWNGFLNLDHMLAELKLAYFLRHISFDLFRYVALLPTLRKAKLGEIELSVVTQGQDAQNKLQISGNDIKQSLEGSQDQGVSVSQSGRFISIGGQQIVGKHSFIFGDKDKGNGNGTALHPEKKTEFDIWYDYVSFASITLALSEDLAKSIAISVIRLASELAAEYGSQATALKIAKNTDKSVWAMEAEGEAKVLADRARDSDSIYGHIILSIKKNVQGAEAIQKALHVVEGDKRDPILAVIEGLREIRNELQTIVKAIEDGGTETFALLISVPGKKLFDEAFEKVETPSPENLAAIREAFSIMDPLSEDDWDETKQAIFERTKDIEQLVSSLIVLTQGFDLLRQIIEHRISEIDEIEAYLDRGAPLDEFDSFKRALHDKIKRKMVTDQEKLSVDAFIPDVLDNTEETHKPGEVLLF